MPFCPKCRYEYRIGMSRCPDCDERLVDTMPPEDINKGDLPDEPDKNWIQIARLYSTAYANMIVELLREKNIPVVAFDGTGYFGFAGQMGISSSRPIGAGISILIPAEYVAEADHEAELALGEIWTQARLIDISEEGDDDDTDESEKES